ncbi:MAG: tol-pal system protein YbgF [Proteobacteria bacterium]|nr:tol-pal system protein YbgF [Pseudomonadota bacterium]
MKAWLGMAVATFLLSGCATTPPEEDPVQQKLADLEARTQRLERIAANEAELSQRVDAAQDGVRELRGRVDTLEHAAEAHTRPQGEPGGAPAGSAGGAAAAAAGAAAVAGTAGAAGSAGPAGEGASSQEQAVYSQAFDALKAGSYSIASTGFKDFLTNYPNSPLADNAQYWLGETYYVNHEYDAASAAFQAVLKRWPDSRRAPEALLKLGYTQQAQKQYAAARATLADVTRRFPGTDSARLAAERLSRLPQ